MEQQKADVIIVGAGIGGLAMAKTYLELAPHTDILILEKVTYSVSPRGLADDEFLIVRHIYIAANSGRRLGFRKLL